MEKQKENFWNYEQASNKDRQCPKCKRRFMRVEFSSRVMTSNPPHQRWDWECDCGYQELGGVHKHEADKSNVAI